MDYGRDVRLGAVHLYTSRMGVFMSDVIFNILTAAFALFITMLWLTALMLLSVKYFEVRMKEKEREREESLTEDTTNHP